MTEEMLERLEASAGQGDEGRPGDPSAGCAMLASWSSLTRSPPKPWLDTVPPSIVWPSRIALAIPACSAPHFMARTRNRVTLTCWSILSHGCPCSISAPSAALRELLGLEVDVLTPGVLPGNVRDRVLAEARPV